MAVCLFTALLLWIPFGAKAQYGFDTISVYFDIGKDVLLPDATKILDSAAKVIKEQKRKILIYGYADYLGSGNPNQALSGSRAQKVKSYLIRKKVAASAIIQSSGVGQINERGQEVHGNQDYRKVDIYIKRNVAGPQINSPGTQQITKKLNSKKTGETIILEDVFFHYNSSRLTDESVAKINDLLNALKINPKMRIGLEGHVCCVENHQDAWDEDFKDIKLSRNRARTIYNYLVENGIEKERVSFRGYGKSHPIADPELTEADKEKNRRVEVRILKPLQ